MTLVVDEPVVLVAVLERPIGAADAVIGELEPRRRAEVVQLEEDGRLAREDPRLVRVALRQSPAGQGTIQP